MKRKSFPFYFEQYIAGTYYLTRREKGAYIDLLCYQADKGGMTLENIKDVLNGDFDCWGRISSKFIEKDGIYFNKKLKTVKEGKPIINDNGIEFEKRKKEFYNKLIPYCNKYPKEMLRKFFDYWTEKNKSGVRMRFELERVFEISKRLATWSRNDKGFNNDKPKTYDEMLKLNDTNPGIFNQYRSVKENGKLIYYKK